MLDGGGAAMAKYDYQPYGEARLVLGAQLNRGYTGHQWDSYLQQYYAPYRYYSPVASRWLTRDPLGYVDGMNMYAYVRGNPVMGVDPMGGFKFLRPILRGVSKASPWITIADGANSWYKIIRCSF